ncbi:hypothetical protein D3C77_634700 [compost metagenome]
MGQFLGIDLEGALIGYIKISNIDWIVRSGEMTIVIGEKRHRGKGPGKRRLTYGPEGRLLNFELASSIFIRI